jgi:uncharacterized HAD superfamily protein
MKFSPSPGLARSLIIDIDGVLTNTILEDALSLYNLKHGTSYTLEDWTIYSAGDQSTAWGNGVDLDAFLTKVSHDQEKVMRCVPAHASVAAITRLAREGWEIHVVSSRPRSVLKATTRWLRENGYWFNSCLCGVDKLAFAQLLEAPSPWREAFVVGIDDNPSVIQEYVDVGIGAIVFDAPWNRSAEISSVPRVYSWLDVLGVLL